MTFLRVVTEVLHCDRCGTQFEIMPGQPVRRAARALARERGWTIRWDRNRTMRDWCPPCSRGETP